MELGYIITFDRISDHRIQFTNQTGTYKGTIYLMRGDAEWSCNYRPADETDPNATYSYRDLTKDMMSYINNIDPSWMNYGG